MPVKRVEVWLEAHHRAVSAGVYFGAMLVVVACIAGLAYVAHINYDTNKRQDRVQSQEIHQNHLLIKRLETVRVADCVLRRERKKSVAALKVRIKRAERFLRDHANGLPGTGITADDLRQSIDSEKADLQLQEGTVRSLKIIPCPEGVG